MKSDADLIRECLKGRQDAWAELVRRYSRLIYSIPRRYGFSEADADDVFQNVLETAFRKLETLEVSRKCPNRQLAGIGNGFRRPNVENGTREATRRVGARWLRFPHALGHEVSDRSPKGSHIDSHNFLPGSHRFDRAGFQASQPVTVVPPVRRPPNPSDANSTLCRF